MYEILLVKVGNKKLNIRFCNSYLYLFNNITLKQTYANQRDFQCVKIKSAQNKSFERPNNGFARSIPIAVDGCPQLLVGGEVVVRLGRRVAATVNVVA